MLNVSDLSCRMQSADLVRSDALRGYPDAVSELGGRPARLLRSVNISAAALSSSEAVFSYRAMIKLLEATARELACPDFGLRLAARQGGSRVLGPLHVAMRNARTVGEAFSYCSAHLGVYSNAIRIGIEKDPNAARRFMRFEILVRGAQPCGQAVENALGVTHQAMLSFSNGMAGVDEVWFSHCQSAPMAGYRKYFSAPVRFEMPFNAVFMRESDLALPIADQDPQLYQLATNYISLQYPPVQLDLEMRVSGLAARFLPLGRCNQHEVAQALCMHPRTLQRKLKAEGTSFEEIKDEVRKDAALRYLGMPSITFTRIATMLGYSESAVFVRNCQKWFSSSPRNVRQRLLIEQQKTPDETVVEVRHA